MFGLWGNVSGQTQLSMPRRIHIASGYSIGEG